MAEWRLAYRYYIMIAHECQAFLPGTLSRRMVPIARPTAGGAAIPGARSTAGVIAPVPCEAKMASRQPARCQRYLVPALQQEEMAEAASKTVLRVGAKETHMFKNMVIGTDGSEHSLKTVRVGGELAKALGSNATIVYVVRPVSPTIGIPGLGVATIDLTGVEEHYWEVAQAVLDLAERTYTEVVGAAPERMVLSGKASAAICAYAKEKGADLIVVGSSGAGLAESIIGSTASNICHHAPCPVLVVR
jgi:nucleotide-binding universal stress UspA family protein